ncbi:DUF6348 family protein [Phytomonospora sp. NPDC050363]|uniref:DUF6348 family protein n=1 Tax=Phytomonospora sp. NPDC050363 TaxID=3155642 RepID=UPI0033DAA4D2
MSMPSALAQGAPRLPEEQVLDLVAAELVRISGQPWTREGRLVRGGANAAVGLGADHTGFPAHLDLVFFPNLDHAVETSIRDCTMGLGTSLEEAVGQAVSLWGAVTASAILELFFLDGSRAVHVPADDAFGMPGWHVIQGELVSLGTAAIAEWLAENPVLPRLAAALGELPRAQLNGVKVVIGGSGDRWTVEVRVNGDEHEEASAALESMGWPRTGEFSMARMFALLVHPV